MPNMPPSWIRPIWPICAAFPKDSSSSSTETGILDIALQTGFHSLSSFNRYFHKIVGSNPQAFRNDRRVIVKKDPRYAPYHAG